jgi:hypothetical protein
VALTYRRERSIVILIASSSARNSAAGHPRWWSAPGRTLENVLAHIEGGNYPVQAIARSLQDLVPADNALSMDAVLA